MAYGPRSNFPYSVGNTAPAMQQPRVNPSAVSAQAGYPASQQHPQSMPPIPFRQAGSAQAVPVQGSPAQQGGPVQQGAPVQQRTPAQQGVPAQFGCPVNHPAPVQSQGQAPAESNSGAPAQKTQSTFISQKIAKINGKDKVLDFGSKLNAANINDFSNVHGVGGKDHARASVISLTMCDYSKKASGGSSETVSYNIDVEDIPILYNAAMCSATGMLGNKSSPSPAANPAIQQALSVMRRWLSAPSAANGYRSIPEAEIADVGKALKGVAQSASASAPGAVLWSYAKEKNNPHAKGADGFVPVSKVTISYMPVRSDGQTSRYPWAIQVENYEAPLMMQANGSSAHNGKAARNRKSVSMLVSCNDFAAALVAVERYVRLWEQTVVIPIIRNGLRLCEENKKGGNQ